jgi:hypothetical protein
LWGRDGATTVWYLEFHTIYHFSARVDPLCVAFNIFFSFEIRIDKHFVSRQGRVGGCDG